MSCYHPLKGFPVGITDNGKTDYKITSYEADYVAFKKLENGTKAIDVGKGNPSWLAPGWNYVRNFVEIPCGHCIGCRLQKSRDWANRMMLEAQEHDSNWFLTLTYNDKHLPVPNDLHPDVGDYVNEFFDEDTGEYMYKSPLRPLVLRDLQLFLKRLRKQQKKDFNNEIRYYACGEYGSINHRPHYHLIIFGLKIDDIYQDGRNKLGDPYFKSPTIENLWTNSTEQKAGVPLYYDDERKKPGCAIGFHCLAPVTWETCAYTARYVTKKQYGKNAKIYESLGIPPEFATMSRRPGLARNFYDENKNKIYDTDELFINLGLKGSIKAKPPRYFDQLYDIDNPDECAILKKNRREIAEQLANVKENLTSLSYLDQLQVEEIVKLERTKILNRKDL